MSFVLFANGAVLIFAAVLMAINALIFHATGMMFLRASLLTLTVGVSICLSVSASLDDMTRRHTFLMTATVWLTAALAGALPLYFWSLSFTDAFFEAISGITTTGSTVMSGLDTTARGILMWRATLQWIGGVGFIVTGIALLPMLKVGGMQLFRTESSDTGEKELGSATRFAAATLWVYLSLTLVSSVVYHLGGMSPFDAIAHAMTTLSTGGFSTYDASFGHFQSPFLQWAATVFMVLASLPFVWYIRAANQHVFRSEQVIVFLEILAVAIVALTIWRVYSSHSAPLDALRFVAFNVASVVSSTGYATTDYTTWGPPAVVAFFLLSMVGGCTGSTAGGIKVMRWIILFRSIRIRLKTIRFPHGIFSLKYEERQVDPSVLDGVISFLTLFVVSIALLAFALALTGLDFSTSISGALTSIANVGPGVGNIIGPAGNFSSLPDAAKWLLSFGMYVGRLEILTIFVLLFPTFWREVT